MNCGPTSSGGTISDLRLLYRPKSALSGFGNFGCQLFYNTENLRVGYNCICGSTTVKVEPIPGSEVILKVPFKLCTKCLTSDNPNP